MTNTLRLINARLIKLSIPLATIALLVLTAVPAWAQAKAKKGEEKPQPDVTNVAYGPHERNVMDVWQAKGGEGPRPLLVFIHGGGFQGGSKEALPAYLLKGCLASGISVASINYRLSPEVKFPAHYMDSARAIQFARSKAKEWNLDSKRVAASGGSAGAGTSLWIGFHDDLADPNSTDPVLRESTRLSCMVVFGAQSTYDPREIKKLVGGRAHEHPALPGFYGLTVAEYESDQAYKLYEGASAINYLSAGDPPVYAHYTEARKLPADPKPGQGIHSINFGTHLKEKMDALGIECVVRHQDEGGNLAEETIAFLKKHLVAAK
jgi:acetyl esterase